MKPEAQEGDRGLERKKLLKLAGVSVALGAVVWFVMPLLVPVSVPEDFPRLPDPDKLNPGFRALLERSDQEARGRPGSDEAVGKLGMVYHANLRYEEARQAYRIAGRLAPRNETWAYAQAFLEEENGAEKEEVRLLERTVQLKSGHVPALLKLGDWNFKVDRLDEAARYYAKAAKASGGGASLQAGFGLGRVAARRGEWNKVVEVVGPLTRDYPQSAPLYELLRQAYEGQGAADKAAEARQRGALARFKSVPPAEDPFNDQLIELSYSSTRLLKHAGLQRRSGDPGRAVETGRRAVQADPKDADARQFLSRTLITFFGNDPQAIQEALVHLDECIKLRPEDPIPLGGFADDFFKSPKPPAAVARLRELLRSRTDIPGVHFFLGMAADELGETGEAIAQYQAELKGNPRHSAVYNKLGMIAERAGKSGEAMGHFQKAVQLNPNNTSARLNFALELMQHGDNGRAVNELAEILRANPHDAGAHILTGFALASLRRTDEAIAKFRQGLSYKPDDAGAHFGLASVLATQGKRQEAVAEVREALRLRPDYPSARQLLARLER